MGERKTPKVLLQISVEQMFGMLRTNSPQITEAIVALYTTALEDELYGRKVGVTSAIVILDPVKGLSVVIEVVSLDIDGEKIAYRYSSYAQDGEWQLGTPEDAANEAVAAYLDRVTGEG